MKTLGVFFGLLITLFLSPVYAQSTLDLDNPEIGPSSKPTDKISIGPVQNISFGGAFDARFVAPDNQKSEWLIHVNELVMTATIGDNISVLAEQLLPTTEQVSAVGQDHGYAYAIFSNYAFFPEGMSVKIGRFRAKWGYDARSDSPANPIQSLGLRNVGQITDTGMEISGYLTSAIDYNVSIQNGPDTLFVDTTDGSGNPIQVKNMANNPDHSYIARLYYEPSSVYGLGISFFKGNSYGWKNGLGFEHTTMQYYGALDRSQLIQKERFAIDASLRLEGWTLNAETGFGTDTDTLGNHTLSTQMCRADYELNPGILSWLGQLDYINDGDPSTSDPLIASTALTYRLTDKSFVRLFYISELTSKPEGMLGGVQFLLAY